MTFRGCSFLHDSKPDAQTSMFGLISCNKGQTMWNVLEGEMGERGENEYQMCENEIER